MMEGECSCGARSPCVHIAAVSIAAARLTQQSPADYHLGRRSGVEWPSVPGANGLTQGAVAQQALLYLLESPHSPQTHAESCHAGSFHAGSFHAESCHAGSFHAGSFGTLRMTVCVGQSTAAGEHGQAKRASRFIPRFSFGTLAFPRFVNAQDEEILRILVGEQTEGPWALRDEAGADLLRSSVETGRAYWKSLSRPALRAGAARRVHASWVVLPNGDQRLICRPDGPRSGNSSAVDPDTGDSAFALLELQAPMFIDPATNECGTLESAYPIELLRTYSNHPPVAPERVAEVEAQIGRDSGAMPFPRLRTIAIQPQPLRSLRGRLMLTAAPQAVLQFLYNEAPVDGGTLNSSPSTVRVMRGDLLLQIDRDRPGERGLQAQLAAALAHPGPGHSAASADPAVLSSAFDRNAWLSFMLNGLPTLRASGWDVVIRDRFPYRTIASSDWQLDLDSHRSAQWFDLRLSVVIDGESVNLLPALVAYLQGSLDKDGVAQASSGAGYCCIGEQLLIRLDDGRYLPVPLQRVQRIADTLVELSDANGLNDRQSLSLPKVQASRLVQLTAMPGAPALRSTDNALLALIGDLSNFSGIEPLDAPAGFQAVLRPYQQEGLGWLQFLRRHRLGGILADDMGLGKTVQTLAHLALEKGANRLRKPSLIVAPVSVIGNWQAEISRFAPALKVLTLHGAKRKESYDAIDHADIVITAYPLLQIDSEILSARRFYFVILDEAQVIKNPGAKVSQAARALLAEHRLCLTGTPMENHLGELWSLFDFLQPGFLGDERHFQRFYRTPIEKNGDRNRHQALTRRIAPFLLRRTKDAVAPELPFKTQILESIVLDERQRDFYDGIRLAMHRRVREVIEKQGLARSQIVFLDALLKLRQACCDPRLVAGSDAQSIPSAKLEWLSNVLPELVAEGRRILLFSQFTSMLRLIAAAVGELDIPYLMLTGETQRRAALVEQFQAGGIPLFLISLKAGGTGLNLTAADIVIHYDPWWNPAAEAQATDRAHRIGQQQPVFVYKLIAQGTVEEKIVQLQATKDALARQLFTDKNASPARLTAADLEVLLAP
jgi:superfamily II DNA or RNA helicase